MKKLILGLGVVASCVPLATVVACDSTTVTSTNEENPKDFYLGQPEETPTQPKTEGKYSDTSKWKKLSDDPKKDYRVYEDITHLGETGWMEGADWEDYTKYLTPADVDSTYNPTLGISYSNGFLGSLIDDYVKFKGIEYFKQFDEHLPSVKYDPISKKAGGVSLDEKWVEYDGLSNTFGLPSADLAVPYEEAYDYMHNLYPGDYPYYLPVVSVKK